MSALLTSLTGDNVNITVGENTNLKGSLIAAGSTDESGVFQDNKNLNLSTKTLTFENSTNTKSSNSQGLGISAGVNPQGDISSLSTQLSTGTSYERTKTLATLGNGTIVITDKENSDDLARLNTDTTQVDKSLFKTDTGTSASGTLDTRLLTAEGRAQIADDAKKAKEHGEDIANGIITVATDDQINITNLVDTVRDNTSATKLKDYLTQTKDGQQILAGLQADPKSQEYHDAQIAANQKLQEFRGLEVEKVVYYDAKATTNEKLKDTIAYDAQSDTLTQRDTQGATITKGDSTGTILLDASGNAQNLSSKQNDTVASGHEVGEEKYLQNGYGTFFTDSYSTKEAMNDTYGAYYAQRLNEATNGGISDVPYATNTNTPSIIAGTNTANSMIIPENGVEYKIVLDSKLSAQQKQAILDDLQKLTNDKLTINDKGEVAATNTKQNTKLKGTKLVDRLLDSSKTVTITTGNRGNTESDVNPSDSFNHVGTDTIVSFDINSNPLIQTVDSKTGEIVPKTRPNQVGLGHELIHADRSMRGEAIDYSVRDSDGTPHEEKATVGIKYNQSKDITENNLRKEQGVEPRGEY